MKNRFKLYALAATLSAVYRLYENDYVGVVLSLAIIPMCFLGESSEKDRDVK